MVIFAAFAALLFQRGPWFVYAAYVVKNILGKQKHVGGSSDPYSPPLTLRQAGRGENEPTLPHDGS